MSTSTLPQPRSSLLRSPIPAGPRSLRRRTATIASRPEGLDVDHIPACRTSRCCCRPSAGVAGWAHHVSDLVDGGPAAFGRTISDGRPNAPMRLLYAYATGVARRAERRSGCWRRNTGRCASFGAGTWTRLCSWRSSRLARGKLSTDGTKVRATRASAGDETGCRRRKSAWKATGADASTDAVDAAEDASFCRRFGAPAGMDTLEQPPRRRVWKRSNRRGRQPGQDRNPVHRGNEPDL